MQVTYPFLQADHAPERLGTQVAGDWRIDLISDRLFGERRERAPEGLPGARFRDPPRATRAGGDRARDSHDR